MICVVTLGPIAEMHAPEAGFVSQREMLTGNVALPVSAEAVIFPVAPMFTVAEKTRKTLNPIPGATLHNIIVEGLSMPAALKEKLKPILAPKG